MRVINVPNVHQALPEAVRMLRAYGVTEESRNGIVIRAPWPVATVYHKPTQRVIFWPERDANPFFHFMEGLWMLAGRNDVDFITHYAKNMAQFSDDGVTFHGAYGKRWRDYPVIDYPMTHTGMDQLTMAINELKQNPGSRRIVLSMWNADLDLCQEGKDFPCNTHIYLDVLNGELSITVMCRSNDILWGCYGANAVHMSMLHEYIALHSGLKVGRYIQFSNNWHGYEETINQEVWDLDPYSDRPDNYDPYVSLSLKTYPMVNGTSQQTWDQDLKMFLDEGPRPGLREPFFRRVAAPIWLAWECWKKRDPNWFDHAMENLDNCHVEDWRLACGEWLYRRFNKEQEKAANAED